MTERWRISNRLRWRGERGSRRVLQQQWERIGPIGEVEKREWRDVPNAEQEQEEIYDRPASVPRPDILSSAIRTPEELEREHKRKIRQQDKKSTRVPDGAKTPSEVHLVLKGQALRSVIYRFKNRRALDIIVTGLMKAGDSVFGGGGN